MGHSFGKEALMSVLKDALAFGAEAPYIARIEMPVDDVSPRQWLAVQPHETKTYWRDRDGVFEFAGLGAADVVTADGHSGLDSLFVHIAAMLTFAHPHLRYYGGFCFDSEQKPQASWEAFGTYRFVLPRFELLRMGARTVMACNVLVRGDKAKDKKELDTVNAEFSSIRWDIEHISDMPVVVSRSDTPDKASWDGHVEEALRACTEGRLDKVVLARQTTLCMNNVVDPWRVLERLAAKVRDAYLFCFQAQTGTAFLGASPERLWKRAGGYVQSEAVAGTRPRGVSSSSDAELGDALLHNDKEIGRAHV